MIFSHATAAADLPGACSLSDSAGVSCGEPARHSVGAVRHDQIRSGRIRYAVRFICWTLRHGSTKHVRWVLAFEGYTWD